jgi:hypothetical protein
MGKEEDVYDELELSEEELLEEQQDLATRVIQQAFRKYEAKKMLRLMIRQNYVKLRDRENNRYIYKNKTTGEISEAKPLNLGKDDLKTPRSFTAPEDYRPGFEDNEGYALVVTVTRFSSPRIDDFTKHNEADHGLLEHYLSHEFVCKLPAENVIPLLNPTLKMFKDALERMRRMCKKRSYLFVYISTHVLTIHSKIKEFKDEDCFLCCKDTSWKNSDQAALTSLPLSVLARSLNSILAEEKVIAVNLCHNKPPQKSIFKSRYFYPPPDCLTRLADMTNSAVIGCCNFGSQISSMEAHHPPSPADIIDELERSQIDPDDGGSLGSDSIQKMEPKGSRAGKNSTVAAMEDFLSPTPDGKTTLYNTDIIKNYQKEWLQDLNLKPVTKPSKPQKPGLRWKKAPTEAELAAAAAAAAAKATPETEEEKTSEEKEVKKKDIFAKKPKKAKKAAKVKVQAEEEEEENRKVKKEKTQEELDEEAGQALGVHMAMPTKYEVSHRLAGTLSVHYFPICSLSCSAMVTNSVRIVCSCSLFVATCMLLCEPSFADVGLCRRHEGLEVEEGGVSGR